MAQPLPILDHDGTSAFLDLYEAFPSLWDPTDQRYKNRIERMRAREEIGRAMGGWSEGKQIICLDELK